MSMRLAPAEDAPSTAYMVAAPQSFDKMTAPLRAAYMAELSDSHQFDDLLRMLDAVERPAAPNLR